MMFRRLGAAVTVIEQAGRIAAREDDDIADALTEILKEDGIRLRLGAQVSRVERDGSGIALELEGKTAERIQGSHLLVAVGRRPQAEHRDAEPDGRGCRRRRARIHPGLRAARDQHE